MSYAPPPLQAHHRPTTEVHPHHVPAASGTHHAHSIERPQYEKSFIEGLVSSDFASLPGASSSQASRQIPIFRPNNANGPLMQPSVPVVSRIPSSHFPPTPVTPTGPSPVSGYSVPAPPPGTAHNPSGQTTTSVILSHEIVNAVVASYDKNVQARLSALESSMRGSIQHQVRTNLAAIDTLNAKLAEDKTLIAKKLDDLVLDGEEKRALAMQNLNTSLGLWQTMMADTVKAAIKEAVGEAAKNMPRIDEKKVLDHVSALGRLTITLDEKASTHRNAIASEINLLHSTQSQMQSQVDSIEARTKVIEKTLTSAISSLASTSSTLPFTVDSPVPHATSSALTITPNLRQSISSAGVTMSIATPELLTSSANMLREHITERTSQTQETLTQFAKTINVARDEDHEVRMDLARMLENLHALQTVQMNALRDEISSLKASVGVVDLVHTAPELSPVNAESAIVDTTEVSTSHTPISLAERMRTIEENQQVLLQYLKNTMISEEVLREVSLAPNDSASTCCTDNADSYITSSSLFDMRDQMSNKLNHILRYLLTNIQLKPEKDDDGTGLVKQEKKTMMKTEPRKSAHRGSRLRPPTAKKSTSSSKASVRGTQSSKQGPQAGEQAQTGNRPLQDQLANSIPTSRVDLNFSSTTSPSTIPSLPNTTTPTSASSGPLSHAHAMDTDEGLALAQSSRVDSAQEGIQDDQRLSVTDFRAAALGEENISTLAGEELLSPRYLKRYRHSYREESPLTPLPSDSDDDEFVLPGTSLSGLPRSSYAVPSRRKRTEKSRKVDGDYVCPRPSCGRRYKQVAHLSRHMKLRACADLRAARMEVSLNQRREASPVPSGTSYFDPPPTKKQKLGRSKHDASAIMLFSDRKARGYRSKTQRKPGNAELQVSISKCAGSSALEHSGDHQIHTATPKPMASRKSAERRLVRVNSDDQGSSTRSPVGQPQPTPLGPRVASLPDQPVSSAFGLLDLSVITKNTVGDPLQPATSASGCTWPEKSKGDDVFGRQFIQCDSCSKFYHYRCVGVKKGDHVILVQSEPFTCPPCSILPTDATGSQKLDSQPHCGRPDCDWLGAQDIFVVDKILGRAMSDPGEDTPYYFWLVKWAGYPPSKCRWEKADQIGDVDKLAQEFYKAADKEGYNCHSNDLIILKEAIEGGYVIPRGGVQS